MYKNSDTIHAKLYTINCKDSLASLCFLSHQTMVYAYQRTKNNKIMYDYTMLRHYICVYSSLPSQRESLTARIHNAYLRRFEYLNQKWRGSTNIESNTTDQQSVRTTSKYLINTADTVFMKPDSKSFINKEYYIWRSENRTPSYPFRDKCLLRQHPRHREIRNQICVCISRSAKHLLYKSRKSNI